MGIKIGIVSFRGPGQSATDRFRYDPLVYGLPPSGYRANYFDSRQAGYDVIIVPLKRKPTLFPTIRQKASFIIGDLTDDMLSYPFTWYNHFGQWMRVFESVHQRRYYRNLLWQCDWVVAGSAGQADSFRDDARGVSVVPDAILDADSQFAANYVNREPCRLVWFGNVESLHGLTSIQTVLDRLAAKDHFELHLVTSTETKFRIVGRWPHNVHEFMTRQQIQCQFHPWLSSTCTQNLADGDIALVPVEPGAHYNWRKPAGRVLLAMALGLPVVASAIPAYESVIDQGRTGYIARSPDEWVQFIEQLAHNPAQREIMGLAARRFALGNYSEKNFVQQYSAVIQQVLSKINS
ncbi:MAG: glycosyltransferase [Anaerolineae bacterium]|nr:glycosyltransferase [Anaerolineae bacterium]